MKKGCILAGCFVLVFLMTACNKHSGIPGYYTNFTAKGDTDTYTLSGKAHVTDVLPFLHITSSENTEIDIQGKLEGTAGNVDIVYLGASGETIIFSTEDKKTDIDINIQLEKGDRHMEFRGDNINFDFDLSVNNIDREKVEYLSAESWEQRESGDQREPSQNGAEVLQETAAIYTDNDNDCIVLNTALSEDTRLNVSVSVNVTNTDKANSISFNGFQLAYKTEADEDIEVIKYDETNFALGIYEWQDNFSREVELPKGTNKLIFQNNKGYNYRIALDICVSEVK